jgi:hypothetical protein
MLSSPFGYYTFFTCRTVAIGTPWAEAAGLKTAPHGALKIAFSPVALAPGE